MYLKIPSTRVMMILVMMNFLSWRNRPYWARAYLLLSLHGHTQTLHTQLDSSGRVIGLTQRPLPDNTQHSQEIDIQALAGIRTHNSSKRGAAEPRLRRCGHRDLLLLLLMVMMIRTTNTVVQRRYKNRFHSSGPTRQRTLLYYMTFLNYQFVLP
jgi:hypothetical protein